VLGNGDRMMPDPILVGRDAGKLERLAKQFACSAGPPDLDKALAEKSDTIFFDAATTQARPGLLTKAINSRQARLLRKPIATNLEEALAVVRLANAKASSTARCRTSCSCRA
jgi:predicted dehydrogenase